MASQETIDYYKSWKHEARRAQKNGKNNYYNNCLVELERLRSENPELDGLDCTCEDCQA